jgi:hypothetical protein
LSCGSSTSSPGGHRPARREGLEHGEGGRQRHFLSISFFTSALNGAPFSSSAAIVPLPHLLPRAGVALLVGNEIGRGEEPVLRVVDADVGGFRVGDRAEMAGDLQPALVRLFDRRAQLVARDLHVGLERGRPHLGPVRHLLPRIVRIFSACICSWFCGPFRYGAGGVHRRPRLAPGLDLLLQVDVHQPVRIAAGPHRRDTAGKIETHEADAELTVDAGSGRVIEVLVHHDEPGDHRLAGEIDRRRPFGGFHLRGIADLDDIAVADHERLILFRRRAGAVDHTGMRQRDHGRVNLYVLAKRIAALRRLRRHSGDQEESHRYAQRNTESQPCSSAFVCGHLVSFTHRHVADVNLNTCAGTSDRCSISSRR